MRSDSSTRHFRLGVVHVSLTTPIRRLLEQYSRLYGHCQTEVPREPVVHVTVCHKPFSLRHRRRYEVWADGQLLFEPARFEELVPYIEWAMNLQIPRILPDYLQFHSSAMEVHGQGVIFPGQSGVGKSTLTAGLLACGWRYLCDEFALVHCDTLELAPYPRAICVKHASFDVVRSMGLRVCGGRRHIKPAKGRVGFVNPLSMRPGAIGGPCPVRYVIFPRYSQGAEPTLIPIRRAEAAFELHHVCYNLLRCRATGLNVIAGMVRGASCYRLVSGRLDATCQLLRQLVDKADQTRLLSA